jgi:hypothetical protein
MHNPHLIYTEPETICEVHVGTFTFVSPTGEASDADFFVKTCIEEDDNLDSQARRENDYNEQLADEWAALREANNTHISYKEVSPCPIF